MPAGYARTVTCNVFCALQIVAQDLLDESLSVLAAHEDGDRVAEWAHGGQRDLDHGVDEHG